MIYVWLVVQQVKKSFHHKIMYVFILVMDMIRTVVYVTCNMFIVVGQKRSMKMYFCSSHIGVDVFYQLSVMSVTLMFSI